MKILLCAPLHREKEYFRQKKELPFWEYQGQTFWLKSLKKLGHEVFVFKYNEPLLLPKVLYFRLKQFLMVSFPILFNKGRLFSSRYYYLIPANYLKNIVFFFLCWKNKPNLILISAGADFFLPPFLNIIKKIFGFKIFLLAGINPMVASPISEKQLVKDKIVDLVVENDRGYAALWKKIGAVKTIVLPISAAEPDFCRKVSLSNFEKKKFGSDIVLSARLQRSVRKNCLC